MSGDQPILMASTEDGQKDILDMIKTKMGTVPCILATLVSSPASANAYQGFNHALAGGTISVQLRKLIATAVERADGWECWLPSNASWDASTSLSVDSIAASGSENSTSARYSTALQFVAKLLDSCGRVSDAELKKLRATGYSDGQIAEIVANVALHLFANYFNDASNAGVHSHVAPHFAAS